MTRPNLIPARLLLEACDELGVTHVVWLPDSAMGPWEQALSNSPRLKLVRVCREAEAWLTAAGLLLGGAQPLVIIQNTGLLDSCDALRSALFDLQQPLWAIIGYRSYLEPNSKDSVRHLTEPLLKALGLDFLLADSEAAFERTASHLRACRDAGKPGVVLLAEGKG